MAQKFGGLLASAKRYVDAIGIVRFDIVQALSSSQIAQALANLGLTASGQPGELGFFFQSSPPPGWMKANGAAVSRTTYANLFAAIGTTFGAGDGSTTFNLPDMRGVFPRGWDNGRGLDSTSGRVFGSYQSDQFASHSHGAGASTSVWPANNGGWYFMCYTGAGNGNCGYNTTSATMAGSPATATTSVSISANGGGETNPKNLALLACIKY